MRRIVLLAVVLLPACDVDDEPGAFGCEEVETSGAAGTTEPAPAPEPEVPADQAACDVALTCIAQVCELPMREVPDFSDDPAVDTAITTCASVCADVDPVLGPTVPRPWDVALDTVYDCLHDSSRCWEHYECPERWG